ncbi:MAG: cob(I)yrinic acid a,c-diamide adenosyltransferase [Ignavibacteria bacterium]|nr:cob(I)yrinic acid a,c-diamide adenosyltransferase [Ignavibacteria bacterium]
MKIYTKTGDKGETSLYGGKRVSKDILRIECYGTVDELNSVIGLARSNKCAKKIDNILKIIQNELFVIGADLATPNEVKSKTDKIADENILQLEKFIDTLDSELPQLQNFILPGGSKCGALIHFARTVSRRAERLVVSLSKQEKIDNQIIIYLNRLSDLLFVMARFQNKQDKKTEYKWDKK